MLQPLVDQSNFFFGQFIFCQIQSFILEFYQILSLTEDYLLRKFGA